MKLTYHPTYTKNIPVWRVLGDLFDGNESWLGRTPQGIVKGNERSPIYLPREAAESTDDWLIRLSSSPFDDRFAQSIRKFTALILANGIEALDIPAAIAQHLTNPDNAGASLLQFVGELATAALRDGHTFVLVDYPPFDESIRSQADAIASNRRPYWVHYPVQSVIDWTTTLDGGQRRLSSVKLLETSDNPDDRLRVRVLSRGGTWQLWQQTEPDGDEYEAIAAGQTTQLEIPLVCLYGGLRTGFFSSRPPLKALADLNLSHYRVKSDHLRKIHLCCLPVPELRDSMRPAGEALTIGPSTFVHIRDPNGGFNWREPAATSIEQSRSEVKDLEQAMDVLSAAYLADPGDRQAALTTAVQTVELEGNLSTFAERFSQGLNQALAFHGEYLGLSGGKLQLSGNIIKDKGRDSQMLLAYSAMGDRRQISQQSLLKLLTDLEFLPPDFNAAAEPPLLNRDGNLLSGILQLPQLDMVTKEESLQLLKAHGYLPPDFDIGASIKQTGTEIRVVQVGYLKAQPTPGDEFIPPT
jgi:hypothetical protein